MPARGHFIDNNLEGRSDIANVARCMTKVPRPLPRQFSRSAGADPVPAPSAPSVRRLIQSANDLKLQGRISELEERIADRREFFN
jgi:hypothetical protein